MQDFETRALHTEIRDFLKESGMAPSYFGQLAAGNSSLVKKLEAGRTVTLPTARRIRDFMAARRAQREAAE